MDHDFFYPPKQFIAKMNAKIFRPIFSLSGSLRAWSVNVFQVSHETLYDTPLSDGQVTALNVDFVPLWIL